MNPLLEQAAASLRAGRPILLFDAESREREVDLFFAAQHATPAAIRQLRQDAGGLVFLAVDPRVGKALQLPFLQDLFHEASAKHPVLKRLIPNDIAYDTRSSFSLTLNHRRTFTGITDDDRSLTVTEFAKLAQAPDLDAFGKAFRAPGHVHLCVGAERLLHQRKGHTELAVALARLAGITPVVVGAEMLGEGKALPLEKAQAYADAHGTVLVRGQDVETEAARRGADGAADPSSGAWMNLEAAATASR